MPSLPCDNQARLFTSGAGILGAQKLFPGPPGQLSAHIPQLGGFANATRDFGGFNGSLCSPFGDARTQISSPVPCPSSTSLSDKNLWAATEQSYGLQPAGIAAFRALQAVARQREHLRLFAEAVQLGTACTWAPGVLDDVSHDWLTLEVPLWTLKPELYSFVDCFSSGGDANCCAVQLCRGDFMVGEGCYAGSKGPLSAVSTIGMSADGVEFFGHPHGYPADQVRYNYLPGHDEPPVAASSSQGHQGGAGTTPHSLSPPSLCLRRVLPLPWVIIHSGYLDDENKLPMLVGVGIGTLEEEGLLTIQEVRQREVECLKLTQNILKAREAEGNLVRARLPPLRPVACFLNPPRPELTNHGLHSRISLPQPGSVMIELVATWGGFFIRPSYARALQALLQGLGVSLIVDECCTAWRCGCALLSRSDAYDLQPDLITLGKWGLGFLLVKETVNCTVTPEHSRHFNINGIPAPPRQASMLPGAVYEQIIRDVWAMRATGLLNTTGEQDASVKLLECVVAQGHAWGNQIVLDLGPQRRAGEDSVRMWGAGLLLFLNIYPHVCASLAAPSGQGDIVDAQVALEVEALISGSYRASQQGRPLEASLVGQKRSKSDFVPVRMPGFRCVHRWTQSHDESHPSFLPAAFRVTPVIVNAAMWQLTLLHSQTAALPSDIKLHTTLPAILRLTPECLAVFDARAPWEKECKMSFDLLQSLPKVARRRAAKTKEEPKGRTPLCTMRGVLRGLGLTHHKVVSFHSAVPGSLWTLPPACVGTAWVPPQPKG
jgi:hypothetical protein